MKSIDCITFKFIDMKKNVLFIVMALFLCVTAQAQIVSSRSVSISSKPERPTETLWYLRGGLNMAGLAGDGAEGLDRKAAYSFAYGFQKPISTLGAYWGMDFGLGSRGYKVDEIKALIKRERNDVRLLSGEKLSLDKKRHIGLKKTISGKREGKLLFSLSRNHFIIFDFRALNAVVLNIEGGGIKHSANIPIPKEMEFSLSLFYESPVLEMFLNNRRFDLLVNSKYFPLVSRIYSEHRKEFESISVVDLSKINPDLKASENSLYYKLDVSSSTKESAKI